MILYVCHRLYDLPVAISGLHDVALFMTWTALVVLPSWCLSDCLSPLCQYCISMSVTVYIFPCRPQGPAICRLVSVSALPR